MANLVLIGKDGQIKAKLSCSASLPPDFKVPEGCILSWDDQPHRAEGWYKGDQNRGPEIIKHRSASAVLRNYHPTVHIRIESSDARDLFELIEIVWLHIGGTVIPARWPAERDQSFIAGVQGDCRRLKDGIVSFFARVKQVIGMKLASL